MLITFTAMAFYGFAIRFGISDMNLAGRIHIHRVRNRLGCTRYGTAQHQHAEQQGGEGMSGLAEIHVLPVPKEPSCIL
ncbi:hypothetical protein [Alcanivorax sp.]|uniref:hypothetical protein n=1 Tax=Alcanivorax sp. TaxID=1872427 RepID=UPI0025BE253D|nr:hypothetical protein [Alcanivorax sp.]|tara:strand:- start:1552 stop:1785 length:234 start_codon:yes stop_codon:yes gene_type:complete